MSVLAHVVLNGAMQSEPAATQALVHILNASPDMVQAFVGMLRDAEVTFKPGRVQAETGDANSRPDMTVRDDHGRARILVENKFWAGLTTAQPVGYLADLPDDLPSAVLFIAPQTRLPTVWNELERRCRDAKLRWEDGPGTHCARVNGKALVIKSWARVLDGLLAAAHSGDHSTIRHDVLQLRDLTNRMDAEAFLPLRGDDVTDQATARRMVNYTGLIEDITRVLRDQGIADTRGMLPSHSWHTAGRYLRVYERFGLWLGVEMEVWAEAGITPLWWYLWDDEYCGVAGRLPTVRALFEDSSYYEDSGYLYIPIRLKVGVERDEVIKDAAGQMQKIGHKLLEAFPNE